MRLIEFLHGKFTNLGCGFVRRSIVSGEIKVDNKVVTDTLFQLQSGQMVTWDRPGDYRQWIV